MPATMPEELLCDEPGAAEPWANDWRDKAASDHFEEAEIALTPAREELILKKATRGDKPPRERGSRPLRQRGNTQPPDRGGEATAAAFRRVLEEMQAKHMKVSITLGALTLKFMERIKLPTDQVEERRMRYANSIDRLRKLRELGKKLNVRSDRYDDE